MTPAVDEDVRYEVRQFSRGPRLAVIFMTPISAQIDVQKAMIRLPLISRPHSGVGHSSRTRVESTYGTDTMPVFIIGLRHDY